MISDMSVSRDSASFRYLRYSVSSIRSRKDFLPERCWLGDIVSYSFLVSGVF